MTAWGGKPQERSTYDKISTATHVGLSGLGMIPAVGVLADVVDAALTVAELPLGKSSMTDLGLSVAAIGASIVQGVDQAADAAKISTRVGEAAKGLQSAERPAAATRVEYLAKGIPESQLGPSGKPKIHVVDHGGMRKEAKDAARAEVGQGGSTMNHTSPALGKDHSHGESQSGEKDRVHHEYNE